MRVKQGPGLFKIGPESALAITPRNYNDRDGARNAVRVAFDRLILRREEESTWYGSPTIVCR